MPLQEQIGFIKDGFVRNYLQQGGHRTSVILDVCETPEANLNGHSMISKFI